MKTLVLVVLNPRHNVYLALFIDRTLAVKYVFTVCIKRSTTPFCCEKCGQMNSYQAVLVHRPDVLSRSKHQAVIATQANQPLAPPNVPYWVISVPFNAASAALALPRGLTPLAQCLSGMTAHRDCQGHTSSAQHLSLGAHSALRLSKAVPALAVELLCDAYVSVSP